MNIQYTNIRLLLDRLMRHPLLQDISLEIAVDYTIDFMRIVGMPKMYCNKVVTLNVENYRCALPCDLHMITQVRHNSNKVAFTHSTDSFHLSDSTHDNTKFTYKTQGNIIYTSLKECEIELSYEAIAIDEEGLPLLIDNSSFTRALELYIKKNHFTMLFELGKINGQVLQNTQQEYAWAVGDCHSEFNRMSIDEAEAFYNSWRTMLIKPNNHSSGFVNNGSKEYIKIH